MRFESEYESWGNGWWEWIGGGMGRIILSLHNYRQ